MAVNFSHFQFQFLKFLTIPAIPVYGICVTASAKKTLHTIQITQRNRQMKWCPPATIQKLFIVLHINHNQTEKRLITLHKTCMPALIAWLAVKTKSFLRQNRAEYQPCSVQVLLQARKSLCARHASVVGILRGFYLLKFWKERRPKYPSLHWPPFSGCCHFLYIR